MAMAPQLRRAPPNRVLQEKGGGFWGAVSSFLWTCLGMFAFFYVMSAGQATFRRFQGGSAGAGAAGALPGGAAGVAASSREGGGMFAAKEYSKVGCRATCSQLQAWPCPWTSDPQSVTLSNGGHAMRRAWPLTLGGPCRPPP